MIGSLFKFITPTFCRSNRAVDTFESIDTTALQPIFSNAPLIECVPFQFAQNSELPFVTNVFQVINTNYNSSLPIVTAHHIPVIPECNVSSTNITEQIEKSMKNSSNAL